MSYSSGASNTSAESGSYHGSKACSPKSFTPLGMDSSYFSNGGGNGGGNAGGNIAQHNGMSQNQSGLSTEVKEFYCALYATVKDLDEDKKRIKSITDLFSSEIEMKRAHMVRLCQQIIYRDHVIGKKIRELMWRKGFYEYIAYIKKNWSKELKELLNTEENLKKLERLLCTGIGTYKRIILKIEEIYDLDLKNLLDFSIIHRGIMVELEERGTGQAPEPVIHVDKSLDAVSFALDTLHSCLLSLGDLHRYFFDFRIGTSLNITKQDAARFYQEAFKLNPTIGMAQNQLGTLYYGQNYDLDSIYHYLYSLVSIIPFELSESNVCKLLAQHSNYLENLDPNKFDFTLQDFYARFFLIVDIFFFDKEVPDFNNICHCVLIDLRKVLNSKAFNINEDSTFKLVSILFFCLSKLKMINSPKMYSLNAFLVAVCSDLIDACVMNLEHYILAMSTKADEFSEMYAQKFEDFDVMVRKSRNEYKNWLALSEAADRRERNGPKPHKDSSSDTRESHWSYDEFYNKTQDSVKHVKENGDKNGDPISTRSSDEAKESDLKTPLSCKSKKRGMKLRRRRRKIAQSDDSSCYDSESDMDTDFLTDEEDYTDLSSNFDSDFSDIEVEPLEDERGNKKEDDPLNDKPGTSNSRLSAGGSKESIASKKDGNINFSDNEDIVIEEERIISAEEHERMQQLRQQQQRTNSFEINTEELLHSFEVLHMSSSDALHFKGNDDDDDCNNKYKTHPRDVPKHIGGGDVNLNLVSGEPCKKLIYRNKYIKINPNIIVDFACQEPTLRAIKILFDWLRTNHEILVGCYHSNPEFIHKIMKLLNYCNIDIFTRKVYFEREFLTTANVRQELVELFDCRSSIPLKEDFIFKNFDIFQPTQMPLDWEASQRDHITQEEEVILRLFKMVDFGFFICKLKKFNYRFCVKARRFTESLKKKREEKKARRRERRLVKNAQRKRAEGRTRRYSDRKNGIVRKSYTSNEEKDTVEEGRKIPRKGYLRNRNAEKALEEKSNAGDGTASTTTNSAFGDKSLLQSSSGADEDRSDALTRKSELMCKLWLKNEVQMLEEELAKSPYNIDLTPFLVVDTKALTEYTGIIKSLVKSKKFIVLIPKFVLNDLDTLKKRSENARNVIRWLEQEFKHGNCHLRAQRDNESTPLSMLKLPRKLDHDVHSFIQVAQLCNHMVVNHKEIGAADFEGNVITYLSGDELNEKPRIANMYTYAGILDSIPARYEKISVFHNKFKVTKK